MFEEPSTAYTLSFRGDGMKADVLCSSCSELDAPEPPVQICLECFEHLIAENKWDETRGELTLPPKLPTFDLADAALEQLCAIPPTRSGHAIRRTPEGHIIAAIVVDQELMLFDSGRGDDGWRVITRLPEQYVGDATDDAPSPFGKPNAEATHIELSPSGRFIAVASQKGQHGGVYDRDINDFSVTTDRGDYHTEVCAYPLTFFEDRGEEYVVHASDWNRLDISDPRTGELLTARKSPTHEEDRYLDYFHCGLTVSPDSRWIADAGWVWHPMGISVAWKLEPWLRGNPWESEDGDSLVSSQLAQTENWDGPICFIGDKLVHSGLWSQSYDTTRGFTIFDLESGELVALLAGPNGFAHVLAWTGERLVAGYESECYIWDVKAMRCVGKCANIKLIAHLKDDTFVIERAGAWFVAELPRG